MKISKISVYQVTLPLEYPYRLSGVRLYCDKLDSTIVAMDTDVRDFCLETGIRMNIEESGGSVIADTGAVHLAQSTPATHLPKNCGYVPPLLRG